MNVKRRLYEGVAVPTALYGIETEYDDNKEEIKCKRDEVFEEYVWSNIYRQSEK